MNKWKDIWSNRQRTGELDKDNIDLKKIIVELKRMNGFDVQEGLGFEYFDKQFHQIKNELCFNSDGARKLNSIFEIGCGSGPNLLFFQNDGWSVGGIDYSESLIETAKQIINAPIELECDEAINCETKNKYDCVLSNSVFSYFPDEQYALRVLEIMYSKMNYSMGILDIHDIDKRDAYYEWRRKNVEDFDVKYNGLDKLFFNRNFFLDFAKEHELNIRFVYSKIPGYWNNNYIYSVYMTKN